MSAAARRRRGTSLRTRILAGSLVTVLVMASVFAGLLQLAAQMRGTLDQEARTLLAEQRTATRIGRDVEAQLHDASNYLVDPRPQTLQRFRQRGESVYAALRRYLFRDLSLPERLQVERVKELHQALEVRAQEAFEARDRGDPRMARERVDSLYVAYEPLQQAIDQFLDLRALDYQAAYARQADVLRQLYVGLALLAPVLLLAVLFVLRFLRQRVLVPLDELARASERLGAGDLSARVRERGHDELSQVATSFNAMAGSLETLQRELHRSEERYRRLVQLSPDAIVVLMDGRIALANDAAIRQFGVANAEVLVGRPLQALLHPEAPAGSDERLVRLLTGSARVEALELPFQRLDGGMVTGELAVAPFDEDGRSGRLVVLRDVTARRAAEAALQETEEHLRQAQKMEAVGRLAGGIAHDFNNLLTVITSYCDFLLDAMPERDARRADVDEIRTAANRAAALTRQLLAFGRKQVMMPRPTDVNAVVGGMSSMLRRLIAEDIELRTDLAPDLELVDADPGQLEQVILNLVVNARDAMPQGGIVTLRTRNETTTAPTPVHEGELPPGSYVALSVMDTGSGLDREMQSRIFEPFFTTKEVGKGTGLGLSTVYGIVRQSGGHIRVRSERGQGSCFEVLLPRIERAAGTEPTAESALPAIGGSETVLLVEDEPALRALATRILERSGYRVLTAQDGAQALQVASEQTGPIDLLLTDVVMPGLGGRELAQRLAQERPDMAVLFTSGYTEDEVLRRGVISHRRSFLAKPYSPQELAARVREALDRKEAGAGD